LQELDASLSLTLTSSLLFSKRHCTLNYLLSIESLHASFLLSTRSVLAVPPSHRGLQPYGSAYRRCIIATHSQSIPRKDCSHWLSLCNQRHWTALGRLHCPSLHSGCFSYSPLANTPAIPRSLRRNSRRLRRPTYCYGWSFHWEDLSGSHRTSRRLVPLAP
jgi:hypothetical protein